MALKVYADRVSGPSRAVLIFCKINGINFEEVGVEIFKDQQFSTEYKAINPMSKVPAIVDGHFKLFESHAILIYLFCAFPGMPSHWYPNDPTKRAKIHSILDWHHSNLNRGLFGFVFNTILAPLNGIPLNPHTIIESEEILVRSLSTLENFWLKDGKFLGGISSEPSIADLRLACDVMHLELLSEKDYHRILSPYKKVKRWVEDTRSAIAPHFDEVHEFVFEAQKEFRKKMAKTKVSSKV